MALENLSMFKEADTQTTAGEYALCPKVRALRELVLVYRWREEEVCVIPGIIPLFSQLALQEAWWPDRPSSRPVGVP